MRFPFQLAPILGTFIISQYSYETLWWTSGIASVLTGIGFWFTTKK
jgi:hypothetical protein